MGVGAKSLTYVYSDISSILQFKGDQKPEDPKLGDVWVNSEDGCIFVYADEVGWQCISYNTDTSYNAEHEHIVKKTRCSTCGAILSVKQADNNGLCECQYCKNIEYVWE